MQTFWRRMLCFRPLLKQTTEIHDGSKFLRVLFQDRRNTGRIDLEATEMAMRAGLHRAGAAASTTLCRSPSAQTFGGFRGTQNAVNCGRFLDRLRLGPKGPSLPKAREIHAAESQAASQIAFAWLGGVRNLFPTLSEHIQARF
jgi:hypothetical protein